MTPSSTAPSSPGWWRNTKPATCCSAASTPRAAATSPHTPSWPSAASSTRSNGRALSTTPTAWSCSTAPGANGSWPPSTEAPPGSRSDGDGEVAVEGAGEQLALAAGRPARHGRVALGDQPQPDTAVVERHVGRADELVARALEILGQAKQRRAPVEPLDVSLAEQRRHRPGGRHPLAVIAGGLGDDRRLDRLEARQAAVEDQISGVLVVVVVVDRHADVVEHAGCPQQL